MPACVAASVIIVVVVAELHHSVEDVAGQIPDGPFLGVRAGAQQEQRLGQADPGADGDHPGRLVHLGAVVEDGQRVERGRSRPASGPAGAAAAGGGVGEGQRVGQFTRGQRAGGVPVEVEHPEADATDLQRKGEDRAEPGGVARRRRTPATAAARCAARSGCRTGRPVREASTHGPSPSVNCSSSSSARRRRSRPPCLPARRRSSAPVPPRSPAGSGAQPGAGRHRELRHVRGAARAADSSSVTRLDATAVQRPGPGPRMVTVVPDRAARDGGVGQGAQHGETTSAVRPGRTGPPRAEVLHDDRHATVRHLDGHVDAGPRRPLRVLDRIAHGLADREQEVVALVGVQDGVVEDRAQPPTEERHGRRGRPAGSTSATGTRRRTVGRARRDRRPARRSSRAATGRS